MRDKIFKFAVTLRNYEDMYYREICVQSNLPIKEFCYIILASFEAIILQFGYSSFIFSFTVSIISR